MIKFKGTRKELDALVASTFTVKARRRLVYEVTLTLESDTSSETPHETPHETAIRLAKPLCAAGQKIEAIKLYRNHTGADLKDSKDAIERECYPQ